jgi:hypothetical protein
MTIGTYEGQSKQMDLNKHSDFDAYLGLLVSELKEQENALHITTKQGDKQGLRAMGRTLLTGFHTFSTIF